MSRVIDIKTMRRELKALGYKVRVKTYSDFSAATVLDADGDAVNTGNVFPPEWLEKHRAFFDWRKDVKVRDGDWIVTI